MQYYNPMINYQQRLQQMEQTGVVGRVVTCEQEAISAQIPFDSTINVFTDIAHGKIYVKTFNMQTGAADFKTFVYEKPVMPEPPAYITRAEFEQFKEEMRNEYQSCNGGNQHSAAKKPTSRAGVEAGTRNDEK